MSSSIRGLWLKWKSLKLPWRNKFLVGMDLQGNTFWEFVNKQPGADYRMRRIVQSARKIHHSDVQISPQWHQWLRQTRHEPPSLEEQHMDVTRQIQLKHNARLADERWAAKARYIEKPKERDMPRVTAMGGTQVEIGGTGETIRGGDAPKTEPAHKEGVRQHIASPLEQKTGKEQHDPWEEERKKQKATAANPGAGWQPESWSPGAARKR